MEKSKAASKQRRTSIGELARKAGVTTRTVRYYEQLGLIDNQARLRYARRKYDSSDYYRLRLVMRAKLMGCSLGEIKELVDLLRQDPSEKKAVERTIEMLVLRLNELELQKREIEKAHTAMVGELTRLKNVLQAKSIRNKQK